MIVFLLALIGTLLVMALLTVGRLWFGRREPFNSRKFIRWFIGYFIFNYLFSLFIVYFSMPAFTGPFWGWQWILWPLFLSSLGNLFAFSSRVLGVMEVGMGVASRGSYTPKEIPPDASRGKIAAGIFGLIIVGAFAIAIPILISIFTTWFDPNAKALAAIPNVTIETNKDLPPTDARHIVLVSQSIASYKGQQVLGSNGQNLGSAYNIDPGSYTLQSINHHLWYVAQLSYNNIFVNLSNSATPGFVMVDAEDPQQPAQLHVDKQDSIAFLPGALLNQDLLRHVYLNGYTYGKLVDPTLELDDNLHPYWTISIMQPIRGYTGDVLSEVLLVDAHTGDIQKYQPKAVPSWVDRVMPSDTVTQYLQWWGLYHSAPWFNPSGLGQQKPASDPELLYNNADQPVWLIPMTSSASTDNSSTGVFLFDTHENKATLYPKAAGLGIGDNVTNTFKSTHANIRNYDVATVQLYQIKGVPTWVAIYVQPTASGAIFQDVGIVDAKALNGGNVQFEPTLDAALQDYDVWIAQNVNPNNNGGTTGVQPTNKTQTVTGKVVRVSSVQQPNNVVFYLQISGQPVIITANLTLSPKLPLVQPGDTVTVTYTTNGTNVVTANSFDDTSINLGGTPTPAVTPTATATATR